MTDEVCHAETKKTLERVKLEAVNLANDPSVTLKQIVQELFVGSGLLSRWRRELSDEGAQAFSDQRITESR